MRIYSTMVIVEGEGIFSIDTIEYEDKLWLVPEWIDGVPEKGYSKPARIICLEYMPLAERGNDINYDYFLNGSISRSMLDGHPSSKLEYLYQIVESPEIVVATPSERIH